MNAMKSLRHWSVFGAIFLLMGSLAPPGRVTAQEAPSLPGQFAYVESGTRLYLVRGNVEEPALLVQAPQGLHIQNPHFSRDGRFMAYCMHDPSVEDVPRLYYMDTLTLEKFEITGEGSCSYDWWPGGDTLVFSTPANPTAAMSPDQGIWSYTLDTGALEVLVRTEVPVVDPQWSPDGRTLSYFDDCFECVGKFYTYDLMTKVVMEWSAGSSDWYPGPDVDWSPDGERLAADRALWMYTAEGETHGLDVASRDGETWEQIYSQPGRAAYFPIWSPDGKQIAFAAFESFTIGNYLNRQGDLMTVSSDGSNARKLYASAFEVFPQAWSPDGRYLLFVEPQSVATDRLQKQQLVLLDVETGQSLWTMSSFDAITADWAPVAEAPAGTEPASPSMAGKAGMLFVSPDYALAFYEPVADQVQKLTAPLSGEEFSVSPDGQTVLFGDQIVSVHSQADGSVSASVVESPLPEQMIDLRWSPDSQKFGFVDEEKIIWMSDLQGEQVKLAEGTFPPEWSYDGQWMAYCDQEGRLWIAREGKPADWIVQQRSCSVPWSPAQALLGYITYPSQDTENFADGTAFLYDPVQGQTKEIARSVSGMDWSSDGKLLSISRITSVGASNIAYTVTVVNPETGAEQPMDEYHGEMYENTTWIEQTDGYLFGRYRFQSDLLAKEPVADHLVDATRDGDKLLVASGSDEALEIACQETSGRIPLLNVSLADTPGAAMPGLRGLFSPDGQWILVGDYVEDRTVNWLARCEAGALEQLPHNTWLFDQYFSHDSAWLIMENIRTSNEALASISLQELASGQIREVQAGLNTRSAWFQMPEAPPAPTAAPTEEIAPADSSAPTSSGAPLNLESDLPFVSDRVAFLSICLWAGALIAIVILMVYLWRWSLRNSKVSPPVEQKSLTEPEPPAAILPTPKLSPEELEAAFRKGRELVHAGQADEGILELQKVVVAAPDNDEAWFWLGIAAARQKNYRTAERCFLQAKKNGHPEADKALEWLKKQKA